MFGRPNHRKLLTAAAAAAIFAVWGCTDEPRAGNGPRPQQAAASCPSEAASGGSRVAIGSVTMPVRPLILNNSQVALRLTAPEDRATAQRLVTIARSATETALLQLRCVEADRQPGAIWEVYVGLPPAAKPSAESPHFVGNVAMFGDGIRSEPPYKPFAEFVFPLDRAIAASSDASALTVTFVPSSGVEVDGRRVPAEVKAPVRIGEVNLVLDKAQPTRQR